jgi:RNA polymerase sigma factor (TIGR02999 family)
LRSYMSVSETMDLLRAANRSDGEASHRLFTVMYAELKRLARANLRKGGRPAMLDTTMLVHESFLRFARQAGYTPADKRGFYTYVSKVMRAVVVDVVRERQARKRGGGQMPVTLTTDVADRPGDDARLLAIEDALNALEKIAPDLKELVEMRFFGGLTIAQIGEISGKAARTVERDWVKGRTLLRCLIEEG